MELVYFYILSFIVVVSAVFVVFLRRPLHNVLFMILTMIGVACLMLQLEAEFIAMVQLIVYAGAVMVLFLFVVMLVNITQADLLSQLSAVRGWAGALVAFAIFGVILTVFKVGGQTAAPQAQAAQHLTNTELVARELFTTYLLPFEVASVLLLAAIIGAVILVRKGR
ncbi:MAG: NADH-quinone oxidoreductase subunit J [Deltaproteobacteria bacterium]|nr:NADH-quinone oxidoreductase subunit J [Deltaproteobacteria bacterium]